MKKYLNSRSLRQKHVGEGRIEIIEAANIEELTINNPTLKQHKYKTGCYYQTIDPAGKSKVILKY